MLDKNIDLLLIGDNYLSHLIGLDYLKSGKKVLILTQPSDNSDQSYINDTEKAQYPASRHTSDAHFNTCSLLEYGCIKSWLSRYEDIEIDLEEAFEVESRLVYVDDTLFYLGRSQIRSNLLELARKCTGLFSSEQIKSIIAIDEQKDKSYQEYLIELGENFYNFQSIQSFDQRNFFDTKDPLLEELYNSFCSYIMAQKKNNDFHFSDALVYGFRSSYHDAYVSHISKLEALHLFINLISPNFQIKSLLLKNQIRHCYLEKGGMQRNATVREWKFDNGKPWCVELNTFEGIVHPRYILFMGPLPSRLPFLVSGKEYYVKYLLRFKKTQDYLGPIQTTSYFKSHFMGSRYPSWQYSDDGEFVNFKVSVLYKDAQKSDFLKTRLIKLLEKENLLNDLEFQSIQLVSDIAIKNVSNSINFAQKVKLSFGKPGAQRVGLKNVEVLGPLKCGALGLFSTLLEAKDFLKYHR